MVESKEEKGFVKDREIILTEVELKVNRNNAEQVDKITFKTDKGDITWKPTLDKTVYEGGFKVVSKVQMEKSLLPTGMQEMAMKCQEKGSVKVKVSYNWWKTQQDGADVTYRFILSLKTFNQWVILDKPIETEEVA